MVGRLTGREAGRRGRRQAPFVSERELTADRVGRAHIARGVRAPRRVAQRLLSGGHPARIADNADHHGGPPLTACMTPDSLSMLLARDPGAIASEARRPPARAVVAPFNLPKVIVQTERDQVATLPLGTKAPLGTAAPAPKVARPITVREPRSRT